MLNDNVNVHVNVELNQSHNLCLKVTTIRSTYCTNVKLFSSTPKHASLPSLFTAVIFAA
jgi:hypothetical protein